VGTIIPREHLGGPGSYRRTVTIDTLSFLEPLRRIEAGPSCIVTIKYMINANMQPLFLLWANHEFLL
jgi:hypothetical protein